MGYRSGEASSEPPEGKVAVAWVIRNRVESPVSWWGNTPLEVVLKPKQFSCWNDDDPNRWRILKKSFGDSVFNECYAIATDVLLDRVADPTRGADHYYNPALARYRPAWAERQARTVTIGRHEFYRLQKG